LVEVSVVVVEFLAQVVREVNFYLIFGESEPSSIIDVFILSTRMLFLSSISSRPVSFRAECEPLTLVGCDFTFNFCFTKLNGSVWQAEVFKLGFY